MVLTKTGEELLRGSMRSKTYFSCVRALGSCSEMLNRYGGHKMAAGLQLTPKKLEAFTNQMWSSARDFISQISDAADHSWFAVGHSACRAGTSDANLGFGRRRRRKSL